MADKQENENNDKSSLLKEKKPRPPQSEKQKENFRKLQEKRAENINKKKEDKIIQAKRELLEKEGYTKIKDKETPKEVIQFNINDDDDESDSETNKKVPKQCIAPVRDRQSKPVPLKKEEKINKPAKKQIRQKEIIKEDSSSENDSDSSEEIVIVRRTKKNKKNKKASYQPQYDDNEEEQYVARPNFNDFFL